eukprot:10501787-Alexandrium_andersonii.AAC.1
MLTDTAWPERPGLNCIGERRTAQEASGELWKPSSNSESLPRVRTCLERSGDLRKAPETSRQLRSHLECTGALWRDPEACGKVRRPLKRSGGFFRAPKGQRKALEAS